MSRIGGVVEGLKRVAMRGVAVELELLRGLEVEVREFLGVGHALSYNTTKLLTDLDTLRELQKGEGK